MEAAPQPPEAPSSSEKNKAPWVIETQGTIRSTGLEPARGSRLTGLASRCVYLFRQLKLR